MTVKQSTLQCNKKFSVMTTNAADASVKDSGNNENAKSYKDKNLEMRY